MDTITQANLLKPAEVCRMLSVSRTWVYAAAADGRLPSIRLGGPEGPLRFIRGDVEAWLEEQRQTWTPGHG
jgi:excisionase family DNA binding protein